MNKTRDLLGLSIESCKTLLGYWKIQYIRNVSSPQTDL